MAETATSNAPIAAGSEDARLESLGYKPQLNRVLGFFENFAVAFTYLSPMVGIYSLFLVGVAVGGPAYIWLTFIPLIGMFFVALVFGELASHYPVAGALFQYSKFSVGPAYGWFVGWFYGIALLVTVAAVDTGVVPYITSLAHNWFGTSWDPTNHTTILLITLVLLAIQTTLNITGAKVMGRVAQFGVGVEIIGTFGIAIILAIHGFHHGLGFLFTTQGVEHASTNVYGVGFGGSWVAAALVAVLAPVYIFYGFESAGDIAEETKDARRQIPKSMRWALIWGGVGSLILTGALLLAMPKEDPIKATFDGGGVPFILGQLSSGMQDFLLLIVIFAFFSCGTSIQGAGSRLAFSFGRDGSLPASAWLSRVHKRFRTPVNALLVGAVISVLFVLLVYYQPSKNVSIGFITYPANTTAPLLARLLRGQRHLPLVPAHRYRGDHRAQPRLGSRGNLPARKMGLDGKHHRRPLSRADAAQRRRPDGPHEWAGPLQPRLDNAARDGDHRTGRGDLLPPRATRSEGRRTPARHPRAHGSGTTRLAEPRPALCWGARLRPR